MSKSSTDRLGGVTETLLIPLYFRALETQRPDAMVTDPKAVELVQHLDYDFSRMGRLSSEQVTVLVRLQVFDQCVRTFLEAHANGTVVDIGCGLNTRFWRVDNGAVQWYDLDLPEVIALRGQLLQEASRCHFLAASALDTAWMDTLAARPAPAFLFVAEGVLPYMSESEVKGLVLALRQRFSGAELIFDAMSPLLLKLHNLELAFSPMSVRLRWGLSNPGGLEKWGAGMRLLHQWGYFDRAEPRLGAMRLLRYIPPLGNGASILHYRLGEKSAP